MSFDRTLLLGDAILNRRIITERFGIVERLDVD